MSKQRPRHSCRCREAPAWKRPSTDLLAHPLLYGSCRAAAPHSRLLTFQAERLLQHFGATTWPRSARPSSACERAADHLEGEGIARPLELVRGTGLDSPEWHGAMSAVLKAQIDLDPATVGSVRPTQGRTLAVMRSGVNRSPSTRSTRCASWDGGCAWSTIPKPVVGGKGMDRI